MSYVAQISGLKPAAPTHIVGRHKTNDMDT